MIFLQGKLYRLTAHLTNRELANMIGTPLETVSRTLNQMKCFFIVRLIVFLLIH